MNENKTKYLIGFIGLVVLIVVVSMLTMSAMERQGTKQLRCLSVVSEVSDEPNIYYVIDYHKVEINDQKVYYLRDFFSENRFEDVKNSEIHNWGSRLSDTKIFVSVENSEWVSCPKD